MKQRPTGPDSGELDRTAAQAYTLLDQGDTAAAIALLGESLRADHRHVPTLIAFGRAQLRWGNLPQAEAACRAALIEAPSNPEAGAQLGTILIHANRADEALALAEQLLVEHPAHRPTLLVRANALKVLGQIDQAREALRDLVESGAGDPSPLASYAEIVTADERAGLIARLSAALAAAAADHSSRPGLHYALGRLLDQSGDQDGAFAEFAAGARLMKARIDYDEPFTLSLFDRTRAAFATAATLSPGTAQPSAAPAPVFIVGMPRSGSTLIEQIISRHPDAFCAGEIMAFADALAVERRADPSLPLFPELATELDEDAWRRVRAAYRAAMPDDASGKRIHVNKLLGNHLFIGAILRALPDARFIVARRDPRDTCLSIFSLNFEQHIPFGYDLGELGRYHRGCDAMLAHWLTILPEDRILEVRYEKLVTDFEAEARRLIGFLGLAWTPACLDFHKSERPVLTASLNQVRQPLYASSNGRWSAYEHQLAPLLAALSPDAEP